MNPTNPQSAPSPNQNTTPNPTEPLQPLATPDAPVQAPPPTPMSPTPVTPPAASTESTVTPPAPQPSVPDQATTTPPTDPYPGLTSNPAPSGLPITPSVPTSAEPQAPGAQPQPIVVGGSDGAVPVVPPVGGPKRRWGRWNRKKLLLFVLAPLVLVLLIIGAVFGLYLPNTPNGVWNTGVNRTGTALDKLTTQATNTEQLDKLTASELEGSVEATWDGGEFKGEVTASFDENDSNSGLEVSVTDESGEKAEIGAKLLTQLKDSSSYPDIYFQVSGLQSLGLDAYAPGLTDYDGKWIVVDAAYLESIAESMGVTEEDAKQEEVTSADISEVAQVVTRVTNEYVFTTDSEKAVLVKKSFVGKEELDGGMSHHYKANINNANAKAYCEALVKAVADTKAVKKLSGADDEAIKQYKDDATKSCDDDFAPKKDMDVWIGGKYRLIQKIRVHPDEGKDYVDIGQRYDNGDEITLYIAYSGEDKSSTNFSVTTNVKTYATTFKATAKNDDFDFSLDLTAKASDKDVKVTPPSGAIKIQDVMDALMGAAYDPQLSQAQAEAEAAALEEWANNAGTARYN